MNMKIFFKIILILFIVTFFVFSGLCKDVNPLEMPPKQLSRNKFIEKLGPKFQKKFISKNGESNKTFVAEETWNSASECFGIEGMALGTLQFMQVSHLENINKVLTELGLAAAVSQLAIDVYKGESYIGTLKFLKSFALYKLGKSSSKLLSAAALSISFIDYSLTKYGSTAIQMRKTKWEKTFENYYSDTAGGKLSYEAWKKMFQNAKTPEEVETIACNYLNKFWGKNFDEDTRNHYLPNDASKILAFPTPKEQKAITDDYYKFVLAPEIRTHLYRMTKEAADKQYNSEMLKLRRMLNEQYRLQLTIKGPKELLKKRLPYKFGPWIKRTNYKGEDVFRFNLFSYLKAGIPEKVTIALSKKDRITVKIPKCTWDNYYIVNVSILTKIDARVLNKENNKPIPGANLVIQGVTFYDKNLISGIQSIMPKDFKDLGKIPKNRFYCQKITSDKYGQFLLDNIPAGIYTVVISADGYNPFKIAKARFYKPRSKPFYLEAGMSIGIKIQAKQMCYKPSHLNASPKPYVGSINIIIDVTNFKVKINFDVVMDYIRPPVNQGWDPFTGKNSYSKPYPCKDFMKAKGLYDMKRLYKLSDGRYEFETVLFKYSGKTFEYRNPGQAPEVIIHKFAKSLMENDFEGIIDLKRNTVKGRYGRGGSGMEFIGTVSLVSSGKKKTQEELWSEIDRLIKDKKQPKKLTEKERKKIMKKVMKRISGIMKKSNKF
jgi:hypothetical protein